MNHVRILVGDARDRLSELPDGSARCCVTSPPYFGLRDYGTAEWEGGDPACDHRHDTAHQRQGATSARAGRSNAEAQRNENFRGTCGRCGAIRVDHQIGLEPSVADYVDSLVAVFREVRRVLTDDGTVWLNLGDSYAAQGGRHDGRADNQRGVGAKRVHSSGGGDAGSRMPPDGLKPKDLIGVPWRVAFALQADGWYLRSDIIWSKPNPMPESVRDRPTKAHEYVFLLAKQPRYFFDADAVRESSEWNRVNDPKWQRQRAETNAKKGAGNRNAASGGFAGWQPEQGRNVRSVWTITPRPFRGAHFATFPPELAERCVLAGSSEGDVVLDPFGGAGTVGLVAARNGRDAAMVELNPEYADMACRRIAADSGMFATVEVVR